GAETCRVQPSAWFDQGNFATVSRSPQSIAISPGFRRADGSGPGRQLGEWPPRVALFTDAGGPFHFISSFNDWRLGTPVESVVEWQSAGGFGSYLDVLHDSPER